MVVMLIREHDANGKVQRGSEEYASVQAAKERIHDECTETLSTLAFEGPFLVKVAPLEVCIARENERCSWTIKTDTIVKEGEGWNFS